MFGGKAAAKPKQSDLFGVGSYELTLEDVQLGLQKEFQGTRLYPSLRFVFRDSEGDKFESNAVRVPQFIGNEERGYQPVYSSKAKFWELVGALYGRGFDTDKDEILFDFGPDYTSLEMLQTLPEFYKVGETPEKMISIKVNDKELVKKGLKVRLDIKKDKNKSGEDITIHNYSSIEIQSGKKKGAASPAPAGEMVLSD